MFAVETSPTLHPARVNGTHGAGGVESGEPAAGTFGEYGMFGNWSTPYVPVQYANDECETTEPFAAGRSRSVFVMPWPCRSP